MKSRIFTTLAVTASMFIAAPAFSQLLVPADGPSLNAVIEADTLDDGTQKNAVYQLERNALYLLTNAVVTDGFNATIEAVAGDGTPPVVMMGTDEAGDAYADAWFKFDKDFTIKGVQVFGCWGTQAARGWMAMLVPGGDDLTITIDDCIFDYVDGLVIQNWSGFANHSLYITNSLFRMNGGVNSGDPWQGFGPLYKSSPVEMMYVENNTFVDDVAPWLVFESANLENYWFNHNTMVSHAQFALRQEFWINGIFMNNLFVDVNFMGQDEGLRTGQDHDALPYGVITVDTPKEPWETFPANEDRALLFSNNNNFVGQPIKDWWEAAKVDFDTSGYQVTDYTKGDNGFFNSRSVDIMADDETYPHFLWSDDVSMYTMEPGFSGYTANYPEMVKYSRNLMGDNQGDSEWAKHPQDNILIPLAKDYQTFDYTNADLQKAGYMGYPVGDLNWWPAEKTAWEADGAKEEYDAILAQVKGGTWEFPIGVGIEEEFVGGKANAVALGQVYPNPVSSMARIDFAIPQAGYVSLKIYNIFGQQVAAPVAGTYGSGAHFTVIQTADLAQGTYLYTLEYNGSVITKKMTVVK